MHRIAALVLFCSACCCSCAATEASARSGSSTSSRAAGAISGASGPAATAAIEARSGSTLTGSARFVQVADGLGVRVQVRGAPPGLHGVHIHEKGNCSAPDASSAGGHYNPEAAAHHGGPATAVRHGGDLGNLEVGPGGEGQLDVVVSGLSVGSTLDGVAGHSIVVHEKADDLHSDPAGNSGARIGCGVILSPPIGD